MVFGGGGGAQLAATSEWENTKHTSFDIFSPLTGGCSEGLGAF